MFSRDWPRGLSSRKATGERNMFIFKTVRDLWGDQRPAPAVGGAAEAEGQVSERCWLLPSLAQTSSDRGPAR
ncbi:unnamed protein product [Rangifer tarandus platyrhynchus]|uniref:Uncharacterized protein n=2 Tax=Rangifer tarandus platyrhynchus TaxID=3082113 RepID=A0ACB0EWX0_RANTA|nr:unnamed protein product [Rangifer tarandus platyrhynchus]CAI9704778.1 unnamed protein product [Rangifer tarandus platyrhynchus]